MASTYRSRTVRLPVDLADLVADLAALWGCSVNEAIVRAIRQAAEAEQDRLEALRCLRGGSKQQE